jgi:hypothetical protein
MCSWVCMHACMYACLLSSFIGLGAFWKPSRPASFMSVRMYQVPNYLTNFDQTQHVGATLNFVESC